MVSQSVILVYVFRLMLANDCRFVVYPIDTLKLLVFSVLILEF